MQLDLDPQLVSRIRRKVESGLYPNEADVVDTAMGLLDERDRRLQELRDKIAIGIEQADRGEHAPLTPELVEAIKRRAANRALAGDEPDPDVCP